MKKKGNIFMKLLFLFTVIPLIELYLLFQMAQITSWGWTFLLVIATGLTGAYLAKKEGKEILYKIQLELSGGRLPGNELINGLCVLIGGALLLTPGMLTDITGFTLIIPATRYFYKMLIKKILKEMVDKQSLHIYYR